MATPAFALFVSGVEGHLVTRFGAGARGAPSFIGARRAAGDPTQILWDTELIVALTTQEVARYRREYDRALDAKALRRRTEKEYLAQLERESSSASEPARSGETGPAPTAPAAKPSPSPKPELPAPPPSKP